MRIDARLRADLAMVLVTVFWGVTFPLIRGALEDLGPLQFVGWRFTLAALAFVPLVLASGRARAALKATAGVGILLGMISGISYFSQTWGLQTVPAGRAAFITGTNVVMVPLLAPLFRAGRPVWTDFAAAALATAGLYLMTAGDGGLGRRFGTGDLWVLLCALSYAVYLLVLQRVLARPRNAVALAFLQIASIAVVSDIVLGVAGPVRITWTPWVLGALLFCATLATVVTFWLQARFQGETTAQRVALIFALEPVFATVFAWWLLGETMGPIGGLGAILVLIAVLGAEFLGSSQPS